jgi:hypothetical protein
MPGLGRLLAVVTTGCVAAFTVGLPMALHLGLWHGQHGEDAQHDHEQCPVCQAIITTSKALAPEAPALGVEFEFCQRDVGPPPQAPVVAPSFLPIAPRAPPNSLQ